MLVFITIVAVLFIIEVTYLKIAASRHIEDIIYSSENKDIGIVRGAGIIIFPALLLFTLFFHQEIDLYLGFFLLAVFILALVSFIDDLKSLPIALRLIFQGIVLTLIFQGFGFFNEVTIVSMAFILVTYLLSVGYINISNFMDGINGMSFLNTLCGFVAFYSINTYLVPFTNSNLIVVFILMTLVFGFFNFRKQPKCFLGDVGSISIGFIMLFFALKLVLEIQNPFGFLILGTYVLDGGWTILERLYRKENIFKTHLSHLYELLVYRLKKGHLKIATLYFVFQAVLNTIAFLAIKNNYKSIWSFIIFLGLLSLLYFASKTRVYKTIKVLK